MSQLAGRDRGDVTVAILERPRQVPARRRRGCGLAPLHRAGEMIAPDERAEHGSEFDADRQRHLRAFADRLGVETERLTWPLERLHRLRDERLRALLRTAKARSPWHATRLAGVDVDAVTGADLAAIPTMTKTDVMEHWDEIVTDRRLTLELAETHLERVASEGPAYLLGDYQVVTTGGSSGRRGVFVWDFEGWLGFGLARERPTIWLRQTLAAIVSSGGRSSPPHTRPIPPPSSRAPSPARHSWAWAARSRPPCRSPRSSTG